MADNPLSVQEFGASFKEFLQQVNAQAPAEEPFFRRCIREHFGAEPETLTALQETFRRADQPNVQLALDAWLEPRKAGLEVLGIGAPEHARYMGLRLADLVARAPVMGRGPELAPAQYINVPVGNDGTLPCLDCALVLARDGNRPLALLVGGGRDMGFGGRTIQLEVMARTHADASQLHASFRESMRKRNVYRGHVISLGVDESRTLEVSFHRLPSIARQDIILPPGVLERVERNAIRFSEQRERLRAARRHLKRGILLYGPPGTGKTYTAMHLAGRMSERTVLLLTGRSQGLIEEACAMARLLEPATVILEDVDLIAEERTHQSSCDNALLFELLNQMDGLNEDADVLFLLTTNRPDILEPALAARPGRVDLAVEVPLPDAECRRRLFELYAKGLTLSADVGRFVQRTEGVSAAFVRELLRLATVLSADSGPELTVTDRHLAAAIHELLLEGGPLMRSLLGGTRAKPEDGPARA